MTRTKIKKTEGEKIQDAMRKKSKPKKDTFVPSGLTLLNLACTDTPFGAYKLGGLITMPGESQAGKTVLALTCFAECAMLSRFDDYDFYLDVAERRMDFDVKYLFGEHVRDRILTPPMGHGGTIQNFEANQISLIKRGKPFIYALDSFDALTSIEELEKEYKKALAMAKSDEAVKKLAGSYGTEKAKIAGQVLRIVNDNLSETNSLLIIIQQRRQKMNAGPFADPWTTAGGEAPGFYANHSIWLNVAGHIKERDRTIATKSHAKVKKNSITGKWGREVDFSIYNDYGVDNIGSCVDFMVAEGFWRKDGHSIIAEDLVGSEKFKRTQLIEVIEKENMETQLARVVGKAWEEIEEEIRQDHRKPKYQR